MKLPETSVALHIIYLLAISIALLFSCQVPDEDSQPNIILIVADDLGYGELGCYGQTKIKTPNIDKLAEEGMKFTNHYSGSAVCAPSRCVLLTGMHSGHAYIRGNHEWGSRGDVWNFMAMLHDSTLEGQMPIPDSLVTFPEEMQATGYRTGLVGKWGLGAPHSEGRPNNKGFDYFFGYNCQRQAHTYYPLFLWENEKRVYLDNDTIPYHSGPLDEDQDPLDIASYSDFTLKEYAPDLMFDRIKKFVSSENEEPFFLFWATPIPKLKFYNGGSYMSPTIAKRVIDYFAPKPTSSSKLTPRQSQIVEGVVEGLGYKMIADKLMISTGTVRDHIKKIYKKLEISSQAELITMKLRGELD